MTSSLLCSFSRKGLYSQQAESVKKNPVISFWRWQPQKSLPRSSNYNKIIPTLCSVSVWFVKRTVCFYVMLLLITIVTRWVAFVSVGVGASQRIPVCFGAKPTQKACARDLPRDRKMTREGRSQGQSEGESSQEKVSQEMRVGQSGDE